MISGASLANAAVLVIESTRGDFEGGFSEGGQTKEHAILLRSLGLSRIVVCVNKMDDSGFSEDRFNTIKEQVGTFMTKVGFKGDDIVYVPASGLHGDNLVSQPSAGHPLAQWYKGPSLMDALEEMNLDEEYDVLGPTQFVTTNVTRSFTLGLTVSGRLVAGNIAPGDRLLILPVGEVATVKALEVANEGAPCALAGDCAVSLGLQDIDPDFVSTGSVICDPEKPVPIVTKFSAQIVAMPGMSRPMLQGDRLLLHAGAFNEVATLSKFIELIEKGGKKDGSKPKRPRFINSGQSARVEITLDRPCVLQKFSESKLLGRFMLRFGGRTVAAGVVLDILEVALPLNAEGL
eukprot:CAMPEP_0174896440 /NCGR_PEP_ID=MMETSP0167-20121228/10619_1 /TAXON_ID=38298 /ORGANISM="Rhodella maculata, Strain CCMP736" /LENGTH=346 /DNA_ID=CAMNT_0016136001 /DNA_START=15 /DNA_END=1055 /DNA_ORIENTATION=-